MGAIIADELSAVEPKEAFDLPFTVYLMVKFDYLLLIRHLSTFLIIKSH